MAMGLSKETRLLQLSKAVDLLNEHAHGLGAFLTEDARGKRVIPYLTKLAGRLHEEHAELAGCRRLLVPSSSRRTRSSCLG